MAEDIRQKKRLLRQKQKEIRMELSPECKRSKDFKILNRVVSLWAYRNNSTVFTYVSTAIEVDTLSLIERCLAEGKTVAVPRCAETGSLMSFYKIESLSELSPGRFGVLEPEANPDKLVTDLSHGLCIIPALSFDINGYRLGFGKGYYDRFLSGFTGDCVGLCYSDCIEKTLPHGRFDRRIKTVVTDKNIYIH